MADWNSVRTFVDSKWDKEVVPTLSEYIKVPNQSPEMDPEFATNGLQEKAMGILVDWLKQQTVKGLKYELLEEKGKTPFLVVEIEGTVPTAKTLLMYGHMDKQPPLLPWAEGLGPYTPVIRDGRLYGRGGADDGYSLFASVLSISALQQAGIPHSRVCIVIEAEEESGSADLPYWIGKVKARLGDVDIVICLDSGALSYDRLWLTMSLRGVTSLYVEADILTEGMHSGICGGVVPDSTRILRNAVNKIEDAVTGDLLVPELFCEIPQWAVAAVGGGVQAIGYDEFVSQFPFVAGAQPEIQGDVVKLALRNSWYPSLTTTGCEGIPAFKDAGNVLRPFTRFKLSIRTPPTVDAEKATKAVQAILEKDPLHGVKVKVTAVGSANGWSMPELKPWLAESLSAASQAEWNKPMLMTALGGTIPFMGMLGEMFPAAQFVITGVLGPQSNAHGPNEFLDIKYGKGVNFCMARVAADHFNNRADK